MSCECWHCKREIEALQNAFSKLYNQLLNMNEHYSKKITALEKKIYWHEANTQTSHRQSNYGDDYGDII